MMQSAVSFSVAALMVAFPGPGDTMHVASATFHDGATLASAQVYAGYGCSGGNTSPEIHWSGAPKRTKSYALTMWDPDAPVLGGWWHWVAYGIPARARSLPAGAGAAGAAVAPKGLVEVPTSFGTPGYGGPCPPAGGKPHHYVFTMYALDTADLGAAPGNGPQLLRALEHHVLAKATLVGVYGR